MIQAIIPILFAIMCNATQYEPLEKPTPLFEQTELNVCLENGEDSKTYLKHVALYPPANLSFFPGSSMEEDKFRELNPEFTLYWKCREEGSWNVEEYSAVDHFVKDMETGYYKIYQALFLDGWWEMEEIPSIDENSPLTTRIPKPISFEPAIGEYKYAGRSDNEQLLSVKLWKYVQKERDGRRGGVISKMQ